jgi:hypothetical protein
MSRRVIHRAIFAILLSQAVEAAAIPPYAATRAEISQMPDFCQARMEPAAFPAEFPVWQKRFGVLWGAVGHYCHGLKSVQRSYQPGVSQPERSYHLTAALSEFEYVLSYARGRKAEHWFLPHVHIQKANAYRALGRHAEAASEMQQARSASRQDIAGD